MHTLLAARPTEYPEPRNQGGAMGYPISEICYEFICIYSTGVITSGGNNSKVCFMVQILHRKSKANQLKGDPYIGWCISSIGNTWVPVKIICISDYCKTTACLIGVIHSMDPLLLCTDMSNYWLSGTTMCKMWILSWGNWSMYCEG